MGGKSTLMRQAGLIVIMAQMVIIWEIICIEQNNYHASKQDHKITICKRRETFFGPFECRWLRRKGLQENHGCWSYLLLKKKKKKEMGGGVREGRECWSYELIDAKGWRRLTRIWNNEVETFGTDKENFFDNQKLFNLVINSFILMFFIFDSRKIF